MVNGFKVGLGIVTCDRPDYLLQSYQSVVNNCRDLDILSVVNDGQHFSKELSSKLTTMSFMRVTESYTHEHCPLYQNVAVGKNDIMEQLLYRGCDYIFVMEDDMIIKSPDVFKAYIEAMEASGIKHMNFAKHGQANAVNGVIKPKSWVNYDGHKVGLYPNLVGSLNIFHKDVLNEVGLYDTEYHNAYEHIDHTYRVCQTGKYHPQFWNFADLVDSEEYVTEIEGSIENTTRKDVSEHVKNGYNRFIEKYGIRINQVPRVSNKELTQKLIQLKP